MKKQIEWTLGNGAKATYTIEIVREQVLDADGVKITVPCCEIRDSFDISGMGYISSSLDKLPRPRMIGTKQIVASVGQKVGIDQQTYDAITAARKEVESDPEYAAKQERTANNQRKIAEQIAQERRNGLCPRCDTYCYGDCQANR